MNYRCRIEIDVEAIDPVATANQAYELLWAADAMKPVVDVHARCKSGGFKLVREKSIDLSKIDDTKENASRILRDFVLSYGGSVQWEALNDIYVRAIAALGITQKEINEANNQ